MQLSADDLLAQLSASMGGSPLTLDRSGICVFKFKDKIEFLLLAPPASESIYMAATLCEVVEDTKAELYEKVLKMNFLLMETAGASLALNDQSRSIVLCYERPRASFSSGKFPEVVSSFLATAERLQQQLEEFVRQAPTEHGVPSFMSHPGLIQA
jgi:hypothetical protein